MSAMSRESDEVVWKEAVIERPPVKLGVAVRALGRCVIRTAVLLARRRLHQPNQHVGTRWRFGDQSSAEIYRETMVEHGAIRSPTVLVVGFRLRHVRSARAHALFRLESVLNTVLFAGFPGFVSKLWFTHDDNQLYRGVYDWDDAELAEAYVGALWWVLAIVSVRGSIRYAILPALHRDDLLATPGADASATASTGAWWQLAGPVIVS
jgi:hypothetical protein